MFVAFLLATSPDTAASLISAMTAFKFRPLVPNVIVTPAIIRVGVPVIVGLAAVPVIVIVGVDSVIVVPSVIVVWYNPFPASVITCFIRACVSLKIVRSALAIVLADVLFI